MRASVAKGLEWRRFPPAVFGVFLGLIALGLVWVRAGAMLGLGPSLGWVIFAASSVGFFAALGMYLAKLAKRFWVVKEELATIPGRQGVSAVTLCLMLIAAGLAPKQPGLAMGLLTVALLGHAITALWVLVQLIQGPRVISPVLHLVFVGFIVGSQASAILRLQTLTLALCAFSLVAALAIYGATLEAMKGADTPPPLRPLAMIHLAPVSLMGTTSLLLSLSTTALIFGVLAVLIALVLALRLRWLTAAGFAPTWAAFTFPVVAFTGFMLMLGQTFPVFFWIGAALLALVTLYVPLIAARLLKMCLSGELAEKTGAVVA